MQEQGDRGQQGQGLGSGSGYKGVKGQEWQGVVDQDVAWDDYVSTRPELLKDEVRGGVGCGHVIMKEGPDVGKMQDGKEWTRKKQDGRDVN